MESINLKKNDVVNIVIEDMGNEGEGIGRCMGFTLFVKDAAIGDEIEALVLKVKKNYGYAKIQRIIKPSPYRVEPICPVASKCGGCQLQHLSYEKQLEFKHNKVKSCLERIGGIREPYMEQPIGMESPLHYRNKAQFPVGRDSSGNIITGFYAGRTHSIIGNTKCYIQDEINEKILDTVIEFMNTYHVEPYNEETHTGLVRHVLTRTGFTTKEVMVCLIINGMQLKHSDKLVDELLKINAVSDKKIVSISLNINTDKTNVILGNEIKVLYGERYIVDYIGDVKYQISPLSFFQVNPVQTTKLYSKALEYAALTGNEIVWDLYCGIGTISLFLAKSAKAVYGVEIIPQAIEDAKENAKLNNISNAEFFVGAAEDVLPEMYKKSGGSMKADVIVVDPPRKGCEESLLTTIAAMQPKRIVYVSCDPATLARDVKFLGEKGYEFVKAVAVDQFPESGHVETVVLLSQLHEAKHHVNVALDMDELDITSAESKATYEEIKKYVAEHNDEMKVTKLYIAQVKRKCGIEVGENFNLPKSEETKQPECPKEKEDAIVEALKAFKMI